MKGLNGKLVDEVEPLQCVCVWCTRRTVCVSVVSSTDFFFLILDNSSLFSKNISCCKSPLKCSVDEARDVVQSVRTSICC